MTNHNYYSQNDNPQSCHNRFHIYDNNPHPHKSTMCRMAIFSKCHLFLSKCANSIPRNFLQRNITLSHFISPSHFISSFLISSNHIISSHISSHMSLSSCLISPHLTSQISPYLIKSHHITPHLNTSHITSHHKYHHISSY